MRASEGGSRGKWFRTYVRTHIQTYRKNVIGKGGTRKRGKKRNTKKEDICYFAGRLKLTQLIPEEDQVNVPAAAAATTWLMLVVDKNRSRGEMTLKKSNLRLLTHIVHVYWRQSKCGSINVFLRTEKECSSTLAKYLGP